MLLFWGLFQVKLKGACSKFFGKLILWTCRYDHFKRVFHWFSWATQLLCMPLHTQSLLSTRLNFWSQNLHVFLKKVVRWKLCANKRQVNKQRYRQIKHSPPNYFSAHRLLDAETTRSFLKFGITKLRIQTAIIHRNTGNTCVHYGPPMHHTKGRCWVTKWLVR